MHHNKGHLRQCRLTDVPCVSKYNNIFYDGSHVNACSCLSNCWYATYKLEISNGKLLRNDRTDYLLPPNYKNVSLLFVFFGRMFSESQMATVVNTWEELSGLYGGLLSLFAGFSCGVLLELIQTVVELIEEKSFKDAMGTSKRNKRKRSSKKRAKLTRKENRW
ncbi:uncharacterized protein LOC116170936 [Photinus pyralis]|nr:uncharacterized protein LOC116170936 [Photinus pyralis]